MKLAIFSDIHLDTFSNGRLDLADKIPEAEICIIAGDIASINEWKGFDQTITFLKAISHKFKKILMVLGNHDYWGSDFETTYKKMASIAKTIPNFKLLTLKNSYKYKGYKFVGDTLWFKEPKDDYYFKHYSKYWIDYKRISEAPGAFQAHSDRFESLWNKVDNKTIVISHHMPSQKCIHPDFEGSDSNVFFVNDQEKYILEKAPLIHVFGHTHYPFDFMLGKTRMLCNPGTYPFEGTNPDFLNRILIEI